MISVQLHIDALEERIETALRLIDETHPVGSPGGPIPPAPISREARGLAVVLLFAAYENLLKSLTRTLLEAAINMRVGNRRLQPGFRAIALANSVKSVRDTAIKKLYTVTLPKLIEVADPGGRTCTIDPGTFPDDGSFMKTSQVLAWCKLFNLPHPGGVLGSSWAKLDAVVSERNAIAHGRETPEKIGRSYTEADIRKLIEDWLDDWTNFLVMVETAASTRDFFRTP